MIKTKDKHINRKMILFFLTISTALLSSCTVLQWRETDAEIFEKFKTKKIATDISYFSVDSLKLNIRIQSVKKENKNVNLLFFHGSPSSLSAWNGYLTNPHLIEKTNMYTVDRPGYGYSNFGEEMTSIADQSKIMSALVDSLQLKNVIVIGSSYGGPLAAHLAVLNNNISGVIMISPAIDPNNEKKIWASRLTQWWITRWLVPTGYRVAGDEKTVHADELAVIEKDWGKIKVPVLHIHGDIDEIVPYENVDYTCINFDTIKIITTSKTGHEIAWSRPDLIIPHILQLMDDLNKAGK